jgi:hypothetical protein
VTVLNGSTTDGARATLTGLFAVVAILTIGGCAVEGGSASSPPRPTAATEQAAPENSDAAACDAVRELPNPDRRHLAAGEDFVVDSFPPVAGPHDASSLQAGWYDSPLIHAAAGDTRPTVARMVHALEHGYVVVLHDDRATDMDLRRWHASNSSSPKLIVIPVPDRMQRPIALLSWERLVWCDRFHAQAFDEYLTAYHEGPNAPEPTAP